MATDMASVPSPTVGLTAKLMRRFVRRVHGLIDKSCANRETAFFAVEAFPWVGMLENAWRDMRCELDMLLSKLHQIPSFGEVSKRQRKLADTRWRTFFFHVYGYEIRESARLCPKTARALRHIPGMTTAMFSILEPGKKIPAHVGPYKGVLRYHLGLLVPSSCKDQCAMRVGSDIRPWEEGKSLIFDDTHEHEAWNMTDRPRAVLFVDFLRPLPPLADLANRIAFPLLKHLSPDVKETRENATRFSAAMLQ